MPVSDVISGGSGTPGSTRRSKVATSSRRSILTAPISTMRAPRPTPVVSRSTTQKRASSSGVSAGGDQSASAMSPSPTEAQPGVRAHDLVQQALDEPRRRAAQGEQPACRFLRGERAPMRVQRIHEPVSATERELKLSVHEHMFA